MAGIQTVCIVSTTKDGHRYWFVYHDTPAKRAAISQVMGRWAADPELNFGWDDAKKMIALMTQKPKVIH